MLCLCIVYLSVTVFSPLLPDFVMTVVLGDRVTMEEARGLEPVELRNIGTKGSYGNRLRKHQDEVSSVAQIITSSEIQK